MRVIEGPTFPPFQWSTAKELSQWLVNGWLGNLRHLTLPFTTNPLDQCLELLKEYCFHVTKCPLANIALRGVMSAKEMKAKMNLEVTGQIYEIKRKISQLKPKLSADLESWNKMSTEFRAVSQQLVLGVLKDMPVTVYGIADMDKDIERRRLRREKCRKVNVLWGQQLLFDHIAASRTYSPFAKIKQKAANVLRI
eukprot:Gregarina_sp_Poly_1__6425@NODE_3431_length_1101_cov_22_574468_g540_i2_p1_GENE_NODE_3431_length_1101_cov_22_574468_g540_i2NODE_3431_length_1101_cov_22_574468_g540_i2_p1_ORF_typecomplete_len195_score20_69_NODE_3431_length_1101_cov_22_574468_g540_i2108692